MSLKKRIRVGVIASSISIMFLLSGCTGEVKDNEVSKQEPVIEVQGSESAEGTAVLSAKEAPVLVDYGVSKEERLGREMRVLLINDDGYDSIGIQMLSDRLTESGYDVWVVAPIENQSGTGTSITMTKEAHDLVEYDTQKFAFEGTPTDCFKVAVNVLMPEKPDLVISGVNDGPNYGEVQMNSGTVSGAARAVRHGYPAIAASLNYIGGDEDNFEIYMIASVDFTVSMVDELNKAWKAGEMLMPLGTGLSINYPASAPEKIQGIKFIENEAVYTDFQNYKYDEAKGGIVNSLEMETFMGMIKDPSLVNDLTEANRGFVTISVIDADWNADEVKVDYMKSVLGEMNIN